MMKLHGVPAKLLSALILLASLLGARAAYGADVQWIGPDLGNWNTDSNWTLSLQPDAAFQEAAAINNITTAVLSAASDTNVAGVKLGQAAAQVGGLRIANGGSLTSVASGTETGAVQVGVAGTGNLTVLGGGTLNATTMSSGGNAASSITLGDTSGLTTTVSLSGSGASTLNRTTNVVGRFVNFNATGNLTLGSSSILTGLINHATLHSALKSSGTASLGGVFKPSFSGVTPAVGNKWTVVDALNITGSFASVDTSAAPALAAGLAYQMVTSNGGLGKIAQLSVEEVLSLNVNRTTGAVSISNIGASAKTFDGYTIFSPTGALTGAWNSLDDQNIGGANAWVEAAPTATELSELNPQGSSTLNSAGSFNLGTPYVQSFPVFGTDPDQLSFEYTLTDGRIIDGAVAYSGAKVINDLVLTVNPANGQVQLKNDSPYDVFIDGYAVYSASGSLVPGTWSSLQDQFVTGWQEAGPLATVVSELKESGSMRLTAGSGFNLGTLAKNTGTGLVQDLRLEFLQEDSVGPTEGTVIYGVAGAVSATTAGVLGDFNNNGTVDAADYVVWRNAQDTNTVLRNDPIGGTIGTAQYNLWRANFGSSTAGGAGTVLAAVPEPGSALLLITALVAIVGSQRASGQRSRIAR